MKFIKSRMSKYIFLILIAISSSSCVYAEENVVGANQIRVYFVGWDIMTRSRLSPEDVRSMRGVYLEINEDYLISNIAKEIKSLNCKSTEKHEIGDIRLVLDIIKDSKVIYSIYANKDYIYKGGNTECENSNEFLKSLNIF